MIKTMILILDNGEKIVTEEFVAVIKTGEDSNRFSGTVAVCGLTTQEVMYAKDLFEKQIEKYFKDCDCPVCTERRKQSNNSMPKMDNNLFYKMFMDMMKN